MPSRGLRRVWRSLEGRDEPFAQGRPQHLGCLHGPASDTRGCWRPRDSRAEFATPSDTDPRPFAIHCVSREECREPRRYVRRWDWTRAHSGNRRSLGRQNPEKSARWQALEMLAHYFYRDPQTFGTRLRRLPNPDFATRPDPAGNKSYCCWVPWRFDSERA